MMDSAVFRYFEGLRGKRAAVLGLGVSNRPLVRLLLSHGVEVLGCDKTAREALDQEVLDLESMGATLRLGPDYLRDISADIVFRTPGMHPGNPALAALRQQGAKITSEMEVFFEVCPCKIIGVTGSDGKTTTTTLISKLLEQAGYRVWVGGNIGAPLLPRAEEIQPADYAVVELSSFQLMDMERSPEIAVVTNLAPNHLDVHKDMAEYISAKRNIFRYQDTSGLLVLNQDNDITNGFSGSGKTLKFSRLSRPEQGVWLENGVIYRTSGQRAQAILRQEDILLPGLHNVENYMAAIAAVEDLVSPEDIQKVARSFGGVEHRIELVRELGGVRYYNDSIASSPSRTIAGLRSFSQKVILIAGGYDKHIPYDILGPEICRHVKRLVLTGATAGKIRDAVLSAPEYHPGSPELLEIEDFDEAVRAAAKSAEAGDVVILSPASAAFDKFKNFMVRGAHYKSLVMELNA